MRWKKLNKNEDKNENQLKSDVTTLSWGVSMPDEEEIYKCYNNKNNNRLWNYSIYSQIANWWSWKANGEKRTKNEWKQKNFVWHANET